MTMSAEHMSKFASLHRQWWHIHKREKFSSGTINPKNKKKTQTFMAAGMYFSCSVCKDIPTFR